jgi:hypothetical protein
MDNGNHERGKTAVYCGSSFRAASAIQALLRGKQIEYVHRDKRADRAVFGGGKAEIKKVNSGERAYRLREQTIDPDRAFLHGGTHG